MPLCVSLFSLFVVFFFFYLFVLNVTIGKLAVMVDTNGDVCEKLKRKEEEKTGRFYMLPCSFCISLVVDVGCAVLVVLKKERDPKKIKEYATFFCLCQ
jgi:di/tricarboxylate transporter